MNYAVVVPTDRYAPSFVDGPVRLFKRCPVDDDYVQAECMRLARHGRAEEAERLLERWCSGRV